MNFLETFGNLFHFLVQFSKNHETRLNPKVFIIVRDFRLKWLFNCIKCGKILYFSVKLKFKSFASLLRPLVVPLV